MKITLKPSVLRWARLRAELDEETLARRVGTTAERVAQWEQDGVIRMTKVEKIATATHTAVGFLFLDVPPVDVLPIRDLRTVDDEPVMSPSPDLLDTVEQMQLRQSWMRDFLIGDGEAKLPFVGSADPKKTHPAAVAKSMRETLALTDDWARNVSTWTEALQHLREEIENVGILIVINGVVGNNTHRPLKTSEFRGFALCDDYAPLVFINGTDAKSAQMFTIAHELAHIWIGEEGVSNFEKLQPAKNDVERYCNAVAAQFLVPSEQLQELWGAAARQDEPFNWLARQFKVSPIVAARCCLDNALITLAQFFSFYDHYRELERRTATAKADGGNFWNTQNVRIGYRFGTAVVRAAKEGRLLFRDAYRLTGLYGPTFDQYAVNLGYRL